MLILKKEIDHYQNSTTKLNGWKIIPGHIGPFRKPFYKCQNNQGRYHFEVILRSNKVIRRTLFGVIHMPLLIFPKKLEEKITKMRKKIVKIKIRRFKHILIRSNQPIIFTF